jgi:segregation and condensation protein A
MAYSLALDNYQGPLEKLLELIEGQEMEITRVSLAQVTGDFLSYVETLEKGGATDPQLVADFLVVASKLILIKSKALLPTLPVTEEEEEELQDLELRLRLYRELKIAQQYLKDNWKPMPQMATREFLESTEPLFYPPKTATPEALAKTIAHLIGELERFFRPAAAVKQEIINLKAKIEEVLSRLTEAPTSFARMHGGSRSEIVVLFLAVLHLIKEQLIHVDQDGHFSEMQVRRAASEPIEKESPAA